MFKRGVLVLVAAAMLAVMSGEAAAETREVSVNTNLKHPVVKSVLHDHGKIKVVLQEDPKALKDDEDEDDEEQVVNLSVDLGKITGKKIEAVVKDDDVDDDDDDSDVHEDTGMTSEEENRDGKKHKKSLKKGDDDDDSEVDSEVHEDTGMTSEEENRDGKKHHKSHKKDDDDDDDDDSEVNEDTGMTSEEENRDGKKHKKSLKKDDDDDDSEVDSDVHDDTGMTSEEENRDGKKHHKSHKKDDDEDEEVDEVEVEVDEEEEVSDGKKHKKQVSVAKGKDGEIVRKYPNGVVRIQTKNVPSVTGKKSNKKSAPAAASSASKADDKTVTKDVDLGAGESMIMDFKHHVLNLTALKNGSLFVQADDDTYMLPPADSIEVEVEGNFVLDDGKKHTGKKTPAPSTTTAPSVKKEVNNHIKSASNKFSSNHVKSASNKFTELATKIVGNTVSKDVAPVMFVCALVGALAAIVGVAAIAIGRVRHNDAAEDPQSVLADAAVEDVEAGIQAKTEEETEDATTEDAPAEKSEALSDSDSDSDVEEGTFANDKNTASV